MLNNGDSEGSFLISITFFSTARQNKTECSHYQTHAQIAKPARSIELLVGRKTDNSGKAKMPILNSILACLHSKGKDKMNALATDKKLSVIASLLEGKFFRSTERMTAVHMFTAIRSAVCFWKLATTAQTCSTVQCETCIAASRLYPRCELAILPRREYALGTTTDRSRSDDIL